MVRQSCDVRATATVPSSVEGERPPIVAARSVHRMQRERARSIGPGPYVVGVAIAPSTPLDGTEEVEVRPAGNFDVVGRTCRHDRVV